MASRAAAGRLSILTGTLRSLGTWFGYRPRGHKKKAAGHSGPGQVDGVALVRSIPCVLLVVSREGTVLFSNQTVAGLPPSELQGAGILDLVPQEHHSLFERALGHVLLTGESTGYEVADVSVDSNPALHVLRFGPVLDKDRVAAVAVLSIDLPNE